MVAVKHEVSMKRLNRQKGMYALLIAVATMIGITIYASCSSDEDFDYSSDNDELFTRAEREMGRGREGASRTYPHVNEIKENQTVKTAMDAAWSQALQDADQGIRREYYFFVYYRSNGEYDCSTPEPGPIISNCNTHANIVFQYSDDPDLCAYFHTHTSLKFCPDSVGRYTGPSKTDLGTTLAKQVPCLVRDFQTLFLQGQMDHSIIPDSVYLYGVERRTLEHIGSNNN